MKEKLEKAIEIVYKAMPHAGKPAICWSGGKDSMVLLDIMRKLGYNLPLIFFREQWQPWKYGFQDSIIRDWGLEVYTWHPTMSKFQQTDDEFEVQNYYRFGNGELNELTCPTGITPPEDGKPWACGLDIYGRAKQHSLVAKWDTLFIGHKGCDSDPIYGGDAGTRIDVRVVPGYSTAVFPLKEWSHAEIWEYIESENVPYDKDRYEKVDGVWGEKKDRSYNCDYVHACMKCVDKRGPKVVYCPKWKAEIENVSARVEWADQTKPSYMED